MKKILILFISGLITFFLCSCSTPTISEYTANRMIAVKSNGFPHLYPVKKSDGTILYPDKYNYKDQLDNMVEAIRKSGKKKILIFVFGGMNTLDETVLRTEELARDIGEKSDYYPILINWESSLFDAYFDHLLFIRRGVVSNAFGPPLAPFYMVVDIARAFTRLPINLIYQSYGIFYEDYAEPFKDKKYLEEIKKLKIRAYIGKDNTPQYKGIIRQISYGMCFPIRVLTTPLIDVCGKSAWDVMKRRSRTVFVKVYPFELPESEQLQISLSPPQGAMSVLMDALQELCAKDKSYKLTLIGHSMGPLIINEMVSQYYKMPYENIVYLAAACSVENVRDCIIPYLAYNPECTFYNLCIHPNADIQDLMFVGLPRGSILEWIDMFLADPLTPSDHCVGQWTTAIMQLPRFTKDVRSQVVIKAYGIDDPVTNNIKIDMPQHHTDFSDPELKFWEPTFWQIPKQPAGSNQ